MNRVGVLSAHGTVIRTCISAPGANDRMFAGVTLTLPFLIRRLVSKSTHFASITAFSDMPLAASLAPSYATITADCRRNIRWQISIVPNTKIKSTGSTNASSATATPVREWPRCFLRGFRFVSFGSFIGVSSFPRTVLATGRGNVAFCISWLCYKSRLSETVAF